MNTTPFQHTVIYAIEKAIKVYRRFAQSRIDAHAIDLTINQALLLDLLARNPKITQNEMAQLLFKDLAAVTRMMEILVKRGFVSRTPDPNDRRKNLLELTEKGKQVIGGVHEITATNRALALKGFTDRETEELLRLLQKFTTNCQTENHE